MRTVKADLHYHGPIGFEPYWLDVQGYKGKNLLKLIADACFKRDLTICAITSESDQTDEKGVILKGSIHDRIGYLIENYLNNLNQTHGYEADRFGLNSIVVEKNGKRLYLMSGITPIVINKGKRLDYLIFGSNSVPNFMNLKDTQKYCNDNGLCHGLEHPDLEAHFGIGLDEAAYYIETADFLEGHNAQLLWPRLMKKIPKIGNYTKIHNDKAKKFAKKHNKPAIATSDGHMIESAGAASIEFREDFIDTEDEQNFLETIRSVILSNDFKANEGYDSFINWINWVTKFQRGISGYRYKK